MPSKPIKKINKKLMKSSDLNNHIKELEKYNRVLQRLYFIRYCYDGKTVEEASQKLNISLGTGYNWLNMWNENGYDSLIPKFDGGRPPKLNNKNKDKLKDILLKSENITTKKTCKIIEEEFGVKYSPKQVRIILNNLGFTA